MMRACLAVLLGLWLAAPATAQTQEVGEMRLYIQELEQRVRELTGANERLAFEVNQLRGQLGMPPLQAGPQQTGAVATGGDGTQPGATPGDAQLLGTLGVSPDDPLPAPQGAGDAGPVDLSQVASGAAPELVRPEFGNPVPPGQDGETQMAALPNAPAPITSLSGSAEDEYDLAYGYILTGDYDLAEESFRAWLATFPSDPQAADAQFWLGESHLQQGEYREAASAFLAVYKAAPASSKGPDALLKLGMSLSALGEAQAACATFAEVGRRFPNASPSLMSRVNDEQARAGC